MQDDSRNENSANISKVDGNQTTESTDLIIREEPTSTKKLRNGEECALTPAVELPAFNASDPSLNITTSNSNEALWADSIDDSMLQSFNALQLSDPIQYQNYATSDNAFYDGIGQTQSTVNQIQRHNGTQNYPRNGLQAILQHNRSYNNQHRQNSVWAVANVWNTNSQNQGNVSGNNWNRGRSPPTLNPSRRANHHQSSVGLPKFHRSTSYPGKNFYNQNNNYDANLDDAQDVMLPFQEGCNGNTFGIGNNMTGAFESTQSMHQYLNELMRPDPTDSLTRGYMNTPMIRSLSQLSERHGIFSNIEDPVSTMDDASNMVDPQQLMSLSPSNLIHPTVNLLGVPTVEGEEKYSRKVFVGGLPPDIDEEEITASFRRFGPLVVDWPHKAESKSYFPPKGYAFLLFQDEASVQDLIESCISDDSKLYLVVSSPTVKDKPVQIRPWRLCDADYVFNSSTALDPRKTVFVGGVPRPLKAFELATIMDRLYGAVCYAGIDTDPELKYPKGAGRVAFSTEQSYIAAISARYVQLQHGDIDKRVEVKPYVLDDQMCDECQGQRNHGKFAPFFCANVTCLQYYCEFCWSAIHSRNGRQFHKPLVKEGAERPRAVAPAYRGGSGGGSGGNSGSVVGGGVGGWM